MNQMLTVRCYHGGPPSTDPSLATFIMGLTRRSFAHYDAYGQRVLEGSARRHAAPQEVISYLVFLYLVSRLRILFMAKQFIQGPVDLLEVCCFCEAFEILLYVQHVCIFVVAKRIIVYYPAYVAPTVIAELTHELEVSKTLSTLTCHRFFRKLNLHMMLNGKNYWSWQNCTRCYHPHDLAYSSQHRIYCQHYAKKHH